MSDEMKSTGRWWQRRWAQRWPLIIFVLALPSRDIGLLLGIVALDFLVWME
jgi:hypothetical protein